MQRPAHGIRGLRYEKRKGRKKRGTGWGGATHLAYDERRNTRQRTRNGEYAERSGGTDGGSEGARSTDYHKNSRLGNSTAAGQGVKEGRENAKGRKRGGGRTAQKGPKIEKWGGREKRHDRGRVRGGRYIPWIGKGARKPIRGEQPHRKRGGTFGKRAGEGRSENQHVNCSGSGFGGSAEK